MPLYSSRWGNAFGYGQMKWEIKLARVPLRPYLSVRFVGDTGVGGPVSLSESAFIAALGVSTPVWRGAMAWMEAGSAVRYVRTPDGGRASRDLRGGVAFTRTSGRTILSEASGFFHELNADGVFIGRFDNDVLGYVLNRVGYTLPELSPVRIQFFWNANGTFDLKRQAWANFLEQGPGLRLRIRGTPDALSFTASGLRGQYTIVQPDKPSEYRDLRVGLWYAFTR